MYETLFLKTFSYGLLLGFIINFLFKEAVMTYDTVHGKVYMSLTPFEYLLEFMQRSISIALLVLTIGFIFSILSYKKKRP